MNAGLALLGGVLLLVGPVADLLTPLYAVAVLAVPVLLGVGVLEFYRRFGDACGPFGRVAVRLLGAGLALVFLLGLVQTTLPPSNTRDYLVVLVATPGVPLLAIGSAVLAYELRQLEVVPRRTAVAFALALPSGPFLAAGPFFLLKFFAGDPLRGLPIPETLAVDGYGWSIPVAAGLYGLAWVGVAANLWRTAGDGADAATSDEGSGHPVAGE